MTDIQVLLAITQHGGIIVSVHEIVVKLAEALTNCQEYQDFVTAKENLRKNRANGEMLDIFRQQQFQLQMAELAGQEIEDETKEQLEEQYQMLSQNPEVNEYLNAEYRFSLVMSDIQGVIAEAVPEWFDLSPGAAVPPDIPPLQ